MPGPHPAIALTRLAVRTALRQVAQERQAAQEAEQECDGATHHGTADAALTSGQNLVVGVSGGADSLALAAAVGFEAPKLGFTPYVLIVDHQLQPNSDVVAATARRQCVGGLGYAPEHVRIVPVDVESSADGLEADARRARYAALRQYAEELKAFRIVLGHTGNDQAEQVFLGLLRGSGTRSLAGMRPDARGLLRPFVADAQRVPGGPVLREHTQAACAALGLTPWQDPHNESAEFTRVRVRHALTALEGQLGTSGMVRNLMRTASSAARDADYLDAETDAALARIAGTSDSQQWPATWPVPQLRALPPAIRIRAIRRVLVQQGASASELASHHLYEVERLLIDWRGQGPIQVPGSVGVKRSGGEVAITAMGKPQ